MMISPIRNDSRKSLRHALGLALTLALATTSLSTFSAGAATAEKEPALISAEKIHPRLLVSAKSKEAKNLKKAAEALKSRKYVMVRTLATPLKTSNFPDYAHYLIGVSYREEAIAQFEKKKYREAVELAKKSAAAFFAIEPVEPYSPLLRKIPDEIALAEIIGANAQVQQKKYKPAQTLYEHALQRLNNQNTLYLLSPESLGLYALSCEKLKSTLCTPWIMRLSSQFPKNSEETRALTRAFPDLGDRTRPNYATKLTLTYKTKDGDQLAFDEAMTVYLNGKSGDAVKAFQLFNDTFPRSTYRFRAKYWLARSYQKEKNTEQAKKLLSEIYRDSPLTYYGLLSSLELGTPIAKRFSAEVPEVAEIDPYVTPVEAIRLRRAQKLIAADLGEFATLDLKELKARDSATNEYLLYLAALNSEAGNHVGAFGLLSELIARGYEGIYSSFGLKLVFPVVQQELIKKNSAAIDLDPILALSLMKQESAFDAIVHSSSGASGLMQLMPTTAVDTEPTVKRSLLLDPDTNIRVGTKYLKKMLNRYDGNVAMALAAYNAGPGAVDRWIREGKAKLGLLEFIEAIPFKETREYVGSILRNYYWYTQKIKGETIPDLSRFWVNPKNMSVPSAPAPGPSAEPATPGVPAPVAPDTAPEIQGPRPRANPSDSPTTQSTVPSAGQE